MQNKKLHPILFVMGTVVVSIAAIALMPTVINSVSRMIYKIQNDASNINFDDMGPELEKKDATEVVPEER